MIPEEHKKSLMNMREYYVGLSRGKTIKEDCGREEWVVGYPFWKQVTINQYPYDNAIEVCAAYHRTIQVLDFKENGEMYTKKWYAVHPETLSPFSGFFECNGEPIFFGDIIWVYKRVKDGPDVGILGPVLVLYDSKQRSSFVKYLCDKNHWESAISLYYYSGFYFKVVGNVWDSDEYMEDWFGENNAKALSKHYYVTLPEDYQTKEYKEILRLAGMLTSEGIDHALTKFGDGWKIKFPNLNTNPELEAVEHGFSIGCNRDQIEVRNTVPNGDRDIEGFLSAEQALKIIKKYFRELRRKK